MTKSLKKVYIPSGLIASLYNVYGGRGVEGDALTTFDTQLLCAFTEFYYNYTEIEKKQNVYLFYTLPQFYKAYIDVANDDRVQEENSTLERQYVRRVFDERDYGELYIAAKNLAAKKWAKIDYVLAKGVPNEVDRALYNPEYSQSIDYSALATNPLAYAKQVYNEQNFRTLAIYKRERLSRVDPSKRLSLFSQKPCRDESCFFILNPNKSAIIMNNNQFYNADRDMYMRLRNFFNSDSYKAMADQKRENYAPDVDTFLKYFCKAVAVFNKMKFTEDNRDFSLTIKQAEDDLLDIEIVGE